VQTLCPFVKLGYERSLPFFGKKESEFEPKGR
jgi:hypothetical protein